MGERLKGSCLCGACTFTAEPAAEAGVCHCGMCRKFSGGMFIAVVCEGLAFDEGSPVTTYASSDWGRRLFCATCGSTLVWQMADGSSAAASIQCFDDPGRFRLTTQLFIDRKPASYALANETENLTEAEFMALFGPDAEGGA